MEKLNLDLNQDLELALLIFKNQYKKKFLHQLVSSQLDMDRLDYLKRDSFYSGVIEGNVGTDRIINMMNIVDDELVIEQKGIYSIEKFLIARRLMYWQVYLHKTVVAAEHMLINVLKRAKYLVKNNNKIFVPPSLENLLKNDFSKTDFEKNPQILNSFATLDDFDIYTCLKYWQYNDDFVLSNISQQLLNRKILKIKITKKPISIKEINKLKNLFIKKHNCSKEEASYFIFSCKISNSTYSIKKSNINILMKNKNIIDITSASDQFNIKVLNKTINKYFLCYPND